MRLAKALHSLILSAILIVECALLGGCSTILKETEKSSEQQLLVDPLEAPLQSPFQLSVADESYDGEMLSVSGTVVGAIPWAPHEVAIQLVGYREGKEAVRATTSVAALAQFQDPAEEIEPVIDAGGEVPFAATINARELAHYQLELLWGKDAQYALAIAQRPTLAEVRTNIESCQSPDECQEQFRVSATLHNGGSARVDEVTLGISYGWVPEGEISPSPITDRDTPEGEELLTLSDLSLNPGDDYPLSIVVPMTPSNRTGGHFEPTIRVVAAKVS